MRQAAHEFQPLIAALGLVGAAAAALIVSVVFGAAHPRLEIVLQLAALALLTAGGALSWRALRRSRGTIAALRRSEARHRAIVEEAGEAILVIDERATVLTFNRAAERMFGYSADEVIGTSLERLMTEGGRRAHAAYLTEHGVTAMVEAARLRAVHKGVRKRGGVFPFELTMTEWRDEGRRVFTGVMRDVTDREHAADALREGHARFVGVFENSTHPLFIFALSGGGEFVLEGMNAAAESCAGVSRYAITGRSLEELAGAEARELKRALLNCLSTASAVSHRIDEGGHGAVLPPSMILTPMRSASGEIRAVLATGPATVVAAA